MNTPEVTQTTKDGGPAFACAAFSASDDMLWQTGMTMRDYFAAMAMQGLIGPHDDGSVYQTYTGMVSDAYLIADAMLKAREAKP